MLQKCDIIITIIEKKMDNETIQNIFVEKKHAFIGENLSVQYT